MEARELVRGVSVYSLNEVLKKVIPFLLLPILTVYLSEFDYGIWGTYIALSAFLAPVIGLSSNASLSRHYWDLEQNKLGNYLGQIYLLILASFILLLLIYFIFGDELSSLAKIPNLALFLCLITGLVQITITITLVLLQLKGKPVQYSIFSLLQIVLSFLTAIVLITKVLSDWRGYIYGYLAGYVIITVIAFFYTIKSFNVTFKFDKKVSLDILTYGIKYLPGAISIWVIGMSNRVFINNIASVSETGLFTIGFSFGSIILMFNMAFSRGWLPFFYKKMETEKGQDRISVIKVTYLYWVVLLIGACLISLIGPFLLRILVDPKFYPASIFISWIAFGFAFNGMTKSMEVFLHFRKLPGTISAVHIFVAIINIVLNVFLIRKYGGEGAAISTFITFFVSFLIMLLVVIRIQKLPWGLKKNVY